MIFFKKPLTRCRVLNLPGKQNWTKRLIFPYKASFKNKKIQIRFCSFLRQFAVSNVVKLIWFIKRRKIRPGSLSTGDAPKFPDVLTRI